MNTKEKIKVMQAWVDGKNVQFNSANMWEDMDRNAGEPSWSWEYKDYRIKPEPMEIEVWVGDEGEPLCIVKPNGFTGNAKKKFREVLDE